MSMYCFKTLIFISALEKKCPICLSLLDEEDEVKKMPCSHIFHSKCILPWLEKVSHRTNTADKGHFKENFK